MKWSRSFQAAFERANRNAAGKKCVRGVVDEGKLLTANPWNQFPWIEGTRRARSASSTARSYCLLLVHFETNWPGVTVLALLAKVSSGPCGRRAEVAGLDVVGLRIVGGEYHFEIVGKWGVEKWFRVPAGALRRTCRRYAPTARSSSPPTTINCGDFYERDEPDRQWPGEVAAEFKPVNLGDWFYTNGSSTGRGSLPNGHATRTSSARRACSTPALART